MDRFLARPGVPVSDDPSSSRPTKRPLPPGTQTRLRDCAKVVVLDRRDDPAQAAAALLPTLTDGAASPAAQLDALRRLACLRFVDRGLLASTGVGAAVRRLKRSDDVEVGQVRRGERGREEEQASHGHSASHEMRLFPLVLPCRSPLRPARGGPPEDEQRRARFFLCIQKGIGGRRRPHRNR